MKKLDKVMLVKEVNNTGRNIKTINDLIKIGPEDKDLIPIMLKYLKNTEDEVDKEYLVRCLSVKGFSEISTILLSEFYNAKRNGYRWVIGNAFCLIRDSSILDEMLQIVVQKKYDSSRQMIVYGLGKYKDERVKKVLIELLDDDLVRGHALHALADLKDKSLIPIIEQYLNFDKSADKGINTYIKNAAKKALKRLEKVKDK
jgi:HEAT repeat protein